MLASMCGNAAAPAPAATTAFTELTEPLPVAAQHVVAMDLSAAQLDEARSRETDGRGGGGRAHTAIAWRQLSMLAPDFAEELEPEVARGGGGGGADAISAMFCVQFAFGSKAVASALLRQASTELACTRV